jgi:hypothetical protein
MKFRLGALLVAAMCVLWAGAARAQSDFAVFSAVINADGTAEEDSGLQSSTRASTGNYLLTFAREVDGCSVVAAPRGPGGGQVASRSTVNPKRIQFRTFSRLGQAVDLGFAVIVSCAPTAAGSKGMSLLSASVGVTGTLINGAGAVSAARQSTGIYTITFNRSVVGCGYAATAGPSIPLAAPDATAQMSISPLEGDSASVIVRRDNASGIHTDGYFHVTVFCAQ